MSHPRESSSKLGARIAIIDPELCQPKKCKQECKSSCPVNAQGKECIVVSKTDKIAKINEDSCVGCGICTSRCPYGAIKIVNVPQLSNDSILHSYGENRFRVHKLCHVKKGVVIGLLGQNGIGKSSVLKILANKLQPNFGINNSDKDPKDIISHFKGTESQGYFDQIYNHGLKPVIKPQHVDFIEKIAGLKEKKVSQLISIETLKSLEMTHLSDRTVEVLSGGEIQKLCIGMVGEKKSNAMLFDEPTNFLDIRQRVNVARYIHSLNNPDRYIIVCDHDLSILDHISDYIHLFMGEAGMYGIVSQLYTTRQGINIYLDGYSPSDNMRFREYPITFKPPKLDEELTEQKRIGVYKYSDNEVKFPGVYGPSFSLNIKGGEVRNSEVIVMLGENGSGKTSYLRSFAQLCDLSVSIKPQKINPTYDGTVEGLFNLKIPSMYTHQGFRTNVIKALGVDRLLQNSLKVLSGGELQLVAICLCLGKPSDIYLLDEPSSFLDCEKRVTVAYVIKKFIYESQKTAFVVEHDLNMCLYLADRVIVFDGEPGFKTTASAPMNFALGMNLFLKSIELTLRSDPENGRPRINKFLGSKDTTQKKSGNYYDVKNV